MQFRIPIVETGFPAVLVASQEARQAGKQEKQRSKAEAKPSSNGHSSLADWGRLRLYGPMPYSRRFIAWSPPGKNCGSALLCPGTKMAMGADI
jgi:hypothetical protein